MMQIILDFIYKTLVLFKLDHKSWLVKTLVLAGLGLVVQSIWIPLIEHLIQVDLTSKLPDTAHGWALISLGLLIFALNRHDSLSLDTFNTEKTSHVISLGNNRFAISFPRPMRCVPSMRFLQPKNVVPKIENWSEQGLTVEFPKATQIGNIEFEADAKPGAPFLWYKLKRLLR